MRPTQFAAHILKYPDPNDHGVERMTVLMRVETADGIVGWGEGVAMWPEACRATAIVATQGFAPLLKSLGDFGVEAGFAAMRRHAWWYGEGGIADFALSAIDMALWDIAGQEAGQPLYALFGGKRRESLPANASCHVNKATLNACVDEVEGFFDRGFTSVKLGLGKRGLSPIGDDPDRVVEFVTLLRRALGEEAEILVDIGNGIDWDAQTGIGVARRLKDLGIGWIEEPFHPSRIEDYRALREAVDIPVACGEREWTRAGYARLIETGTVDIYGVDPARVQGISGFRAIDEMITAAGGTINAHAWSTAITSAASLHLSLASPTARLFELKPHDVVVQSELVDHPIRMEDGRVGISDRPGLGLRIDESVLNRYCVERLEG